MSSTGSVGVGFQIGSLDKRLHQPDIPINTAQEKLNAERMFGRQLRLNKGYVAAAAQPTYGFFSFDPVVSGRIQEVLFLSIWGSDPFSTTAQAQADFTAFSFGGAANNNVSIPAVAGQTAYVTGFEVTGSGATAASVIQISLTGTITGQMTYQLAIPAGATAGVQPLTPSFARAIPASAPNTAILLTVPSFGVGNTNASANIHGYYQTNAGSLAGQAIGFISSYQPQDSNAEPPFPNLVLAPSTLPVINAPTRRQVLLFPTERFIICVKGLGNNAQLNAAISVVEYEQSSFLKGLAP